MISLKIKYLVKVFLAMIASDMHRISVLGRIWDASSYNKQSPNFSGSNFFLAHMRGSSSPHGSSPVVTQGPRLFLCTIHSTWPPQVPLNGKKRHGGAYG